MLKSDDPSLFKQKFSRRLLEIIEQTSPEHHTIFVGFEEGQSSRPLSDVDNQEPKISSHMEELLREVVGERLEFFLEHESTTSMEPELPNPNTDSVSSLSSSRPLSDVDNQEPKVSSDMEELLREVVGERLEFLLEHESTTSMEPELQNPNPDSDSSLSSCVSQSKKRRSINVEEKKQKVLVVEPIQTDPPEWLLNVMMREENSHNPKLISTRRLLKDDVNKGKARLLVPFKQVKTPDFLTKEETRILHEYAMKIRKTGVSVDLVDPMMNKHVLDLRKWKMSGNWYYAICDGWNNVVAANSFKFDDFFPLWSFRSGSGKLCFALVPPTPTNSTNPSHGGSSTSGESGLGNSLTGDDNGASASGESGQVPSSVPPPLPARDSSHSGQGCSGESSSCSS